MDARRSRHSRRRQRTTSRDPHRGQQPTPGGFGDSEALPRSGAREAELVANSSRPRPVDEIQLPITPPMLTLFEYGEEYVRFSYATSYEQVGEGIERIRAWLAANRPA